MKYMKSSAPCPRYLAVYIPQPYRQFFQVLNLPERWEAGEERFDRIPTMQQSRAHGFLHEPFAGIMVPIRNQKALQQPPVAVEQVQVQGHQLIIQVGDHGVTEIDQPCGLPFAVLHCPQQMIAGNVSVNQEWFSLKSIRSSTGSRYASI
jgi:hypothetical protein